MDLKKELLELPEQIKKLSSDMEALHQKIKLKELKLAKEKAKLYLDLRSKDGKDPQAVLDAKIFLAFYRKQRYIQKLENNYKSMAITLDFLKNRFSAVKNIGFLEVKNGQY